MQALMSVDSAAAAHKLTLRETTLHYKVEKYNSLGSIPTSFQRTGDDLIFCGVNHCQSYPGLEEIEEVFPLESVSEVLVEPNFGQTCFGLPLDGVPSLVVKLNGSPKASASIDAPLNGEAFAKAVMEANQAVKSSGGLDGRYSGQDLLSKFTAYQNSGSQGTPAGMQMLPAGLAAQRIIICCRHTGRMWGMWRRCSHGWHCRGYRIPQYWTTPHMCRRSAV